MGRPPPDPILQRLHDELGENQQAWDDYLLKEWKLPKEKRSDKEDPLQKPAAIKVILTISKEAIACDEFRKQRESAADETAQLTAAWQQYVEFVATIADLAAQWTKAKRDRVKQFALECARAEQAEGGPPPDLPDGPVTAEDLQRRFARGEVYVDLEFRISDHRNCAIAIRYADIPPDPDDSLPNDGEPGRWDGLKWRAAKTPEET